MGEFRKIELITHMKVFGSLILGILFLGCVDKFDFNVVQESGGLVIESFITDISYLESLAIPSDGYYFKVTLSETSDVDNIRNIKVPEAKVYLLDDQGNKWDYTETGDVVGDYYLLSDSFKAEKGKAYQLNVELKEGQHFESDWEIMPKAVNEMGEFNLEEVNTQEYIYEAGEPVVKDVEGMKLYLNVPINEEIGQINYRWSFVPLWMYTAKLASVVNSQKIICWVRSNLYQKDYVLQNSNKGGFNQELFYLRTKGNERVFQYFSTLINQDIVSEGYNTFWKDLDAQKDKGGLFDQAPFGLRTNFISTNSGWTVNGYFGVIDRNTQRWTFNPESLSYVIENTIENNCLLLDNEPGAKEGQCYYCDEYNQGNATTRSPSWW
ncbi:MAG: hypothetical protein ACI9IP_000832 [Arcticibacterium sp.]